MDSRLPAHLKTSGIMRAVQLAGGFATVLQRGERDAGTILVVTRDVNATSCLYERMPDLDDNRAWTKSREEPAEKEREFSEYVARRGQQDPDCWIIEIEIAQPERFIC